MNRWTQFCIHYILSFITVWFMISGVFVCASLNIYGSLFGSLTPRWDSRHTRGLLINILSSLFSIFVDNILTLHRIQPTFRLSIWSFQDVWRCPKHDITGNDHRDVQNLCIDTHFFQYVWYIQKLSCIHHNCSHLHSAPYTISTNLICPRHMSHCFYALWPEAGA